MALELNKTQNEITNAQLAAVNGTCAVLSLLVHYTTRPSHWLATAYFLMEISFSHCFCCTVRATEGVQCCRSSNGVWRQFLGGAEEGAERRGGGTPLMQIELFKSAARISGRLRGEDRSICYVYKYIRILYDMYSYVCGRSWLYLFMHGAPKQMWILCHSLTRIATSNNTIHIY